MAMSKQQLIADLAESTDLTQAQVRALLDQLAQITRDALEHGEELTLPGLGKLKVSERAARTGRNPQTGASIQIAARKVVKFVPAKSLGDALN
ncbi:MAG TPA: HU family DNA-binding protein [Pseudomonas sp.]|jgi:DNA-binding protein HU-beta|nr:HU family DNA-binding protein [Pseudomonas sp.]